MFRGADKVNIDHLGENFAITMSKAKSNVASEYKGMRYTTGSKTLSYVLMVIAMLFVAVVSTVMDFIKYGVFDFGISLWSILLCAIVFGYYMLGYLVMNKLPKLTKKKKTLHFVSYGVVGVIVSLIGMAAIRFTQHYTWIESFCMMICPVLTCWIAPYIHKRSSLYNELLGEIMGFKNFIEVAEKDKLEALVQEDPEYFYKILPYANVLGVSDVLEEKFKDIPMNPPVWITTGGIDFIDLYFYTRIARAISSQVNTQLAAAIASSASSMVGKFGGGSSGGGFSGGGGFGGGGGGSW